MGYKIRSYDEFLYESSNPRGWIIFESFMQRLKKFLHEKESISSRQKVRFEDWWSVSLAEWEEKDMGYLDSIERLERHKPEDRRHKGDVFLFELSLNQEIARSTVYRLGSLNTITFKLYLNPDIEKVTGKEIRDIYDETLKELYPQEFHGKRYGI